MCAIVDAWWTSSARRIACPLTPKLSATLGSFGPSCNPGVQARIKPGLSRGAIPLLARSVAKEIAVQEPPEQIAGSDAPEAGGGPGAGFEADMHELQAELGDDWILRFSVHGGDGWLTAEKQDSSQRVEAATAEQLVRIVEAIDARGDGGVAPEG